MATHMNGKTIMQSKEKMPWMSEGHLQAQVDCHCPVPRVIPAAIRAPTLKARSAVVRHMRSAQLSLIEVVQQAHTPRTVPTRERLGEVHASSDSGNGRTEPKDYTGDHEHSNILRCGLQDHADECDHRTPKDSRPPTETWTMEDMVNPCL